MAFRGSPFLVGLFLGVSGSNLAPLAARADIYSYVDEEGVIHFTNIRPRGRRDVVVVMRTREGRGGPSVSPIERNRRRAQYEPIIREAANFYHLPPALLHAVIEVESGYHPEAVSPAGAMGLMQLMPSTAERMGVLDPFDPR
ncbi:MAG: transglycosylase SLT domain-containing protein, partial [Sandaracinaceae bacterium]|nr:transglycosylase SLT domain-containing protein [Sandaracinaceae bacterium]